MRGRVDGVVGSQPEARGERRRVGIALHFAVRQIGRSVECRERKRRVVFVSATWCVESRRVGEQVGVYCHCSRASSHRARVCGRGRGKAAMGGDDGEQSWMSGSGRVGVCRE